jgi:hypothetical protein
MGSSKLKSQRLHGLAGDIAGGCVGALTAVPVVLSCGAVLYERLGHAFITTGIVAAFVAAVISALVAGCLGGAPLHVNTPKTTHAAILSGLIGTVAASPAFASAFGSADRATALVAVTSLTLVISGLVQVSLGTLRLGAVVKFIPFPVLASFVNGFAVVIIWRQLSHARFLASTDAALSVAEDELLAQLKSSDDEVLCELADFSITQTLSVEEREVLSSYLMRQEYAAGSDIRAPDAGPALHLLARGRAALIVSNDGERAARRVTAPGRYSPRWVIAGILSAPDWSRRPLSWCSPCRRRHWQICGRPIRQSSPPS